MKKVIINKGDKFGMLEIIQEIKSKRRKFECLCQCGNKTIVRLTHLRSGDTTSCGCYAKNQRLKGTTTHGLSNTRFWRIYRNLNNRCNYEKYHEFHYYGGRGIKNLFLSFEKFKKDMYKSYLDHVKKFGEKQTTIDRIDVNGNYCKENCRWATYSEQNLNTRKNYENNLKV